MPKTPDKKRTGNQVVSPETVISAASKKHSTDRAKRKKRYQFAPIDNLESNNRNDLNVLRSISVSQVRNTANTTSRQTNRTQNVGLLEPPFSPNIDRDPPLVNLPGKTRIAVNTKNLKTAVEENSQTEQVIWKYSPIERDFSDKGSSSHANSENCMEMESCQDPSSTPMMHSRLKSVLNFANISEREPLDQQTALSAQQRDTIRSRGTGEYIKESLRDIEDILDDIGGDITFKPNISKLNDLPSSPAGVQGEKKDNEDNEDTPDESTATFNITNDGDDSLIDILTQKFTKKPHEITPKIESDSLDDSLIDYLEILDRKEPDEKFEKEVGKVEEMLSQSFKMKTKEKAGNLSGKHEEYMKLARSAATRKGIARLVVLSVRDFNVPKVGRQKILSCIDANGEISSVIVRHPWVYLEFDEGDVVHIIEGKNIANKRLLSDDKNTKTQLANDNLLILNPDLLLSATSVGGSIECLRRAVIQATLDDTRGEPSLVMTIGNIVHELLQDALRYRLSHEKITAEYLETSLDAILVDHFLSIVICNESVKSVKDEIKKTHFDNVLQFVNHFVQKSNYGCYVSVSGTRKTQPISISNIIDIEESIWSPVYGLKGFLDATVEAHVENDYYMVPLEVKTGKNRSISHEAQGLIYTLLLNDRYEVPLDFFLLLYTRNNDITKYPKVLHSVKHVIMFRNQMSIRLKYRLKVATINDTLGSSLPPLLQNSFCDTCRVKEPCMIMNKLLEGGTAEESGLKGGEYEALTNHLILHFERNRNFFLKYNELINKEESSITNINKDLFLLDSNTKESLSGRCLSNLSITGISQHPTHKNTFLHVFERNDNKVDSRSMMHSQLAVKDLVIISDEEGHFALGHGHIFAISKNSVTVSTKRKLLNNRIPSDVNGLTTIQSVLDDKYSESFALETQNLVTYRIDKNDIQQSLSLARFNLLNLFLPPAPKGQLVLSGTTGKEHEVKSSEGGDSRMRAALIDNKPPSFIDSGSTPIIPCRLSDTTSLNSDQVLAIEKVVRAEDYALILGMPGTGKTTVIAEIIKLLVAAGKSILLASYTHSAVDNILLKLKYTNINITRLGVKHRIHPDIQMYRPDYEAIETHSDFLNHINETSVVATTCLGINDMMFTLRKHDFDYVILDEASQISMPVALGPLRYGEKFIMVGDHYQLPPLVKNDAARSGGLEESLFKMLCDAQPQSVCELTYQYRMCEDIVTLSNFLMYKSKLKCGSTEVSNQRLDIPHLATLAKYRKTKGSQRWLETVLDPNRKVIFLDYDRCKNISENCERDIITNEGEAEIVRQCLEGFIKGGISCKDIGVMTFYRAQLSLLRKKFDRAAYKELEILTADQFQGRDKECVIISMVRSNDQKNAGVLLKELRRVNVAMSRAKSKLIMIGSKATIESIPEIGKLMNLLEERGWIYQLKHDFLNSYHFPEEKSSSQREVAPSVHKKKNVKKLGAKNITARSNVVKDKPIVRQTLSEF